MAVCDLQRRLPVTRVSNKHRRVIFQPLDSDKKTYTRRSPIVVRVSALVNTRRQTRLDTCTAGVCPITSKMRFPISSELRPSSLCLELTTYFNFLCLHCSQAKAARRRFRGRFGSCSCTLMSADVTGLLRRYSEAPLSKLRPR